nr:hypothetical protein [uncultured Albidiferax sp.]
MKRAVRSPKLVAPNEHAPNTRNGAQYDAIVAHINQSGPCGFRKLFALFADKSNPSTAAKIFRNRLHKLVEKGQLVTTGQRLLRVWAIAPDAVTVTVSRKPAPPALYVGQLVPPRQYDVMQGIYLPPAAPNLRPGALDFAHVPSRGVAC